MLTVGATQGFSGVDHIVLYFAETVSAVLSGLPANHFPRQTLSFLSHYNKHSKRLYLHFFRLSVVARHSGTFLKANSVPCFFYLEMSSYCYSLSHLS